MTEKTQSFRHVSLEQVKAILDFMGQHVDFASGSLRTLEARHTSKKLWNDLTKILNSSRAGVKKTADGWSKYWSDFKNKLKNKTSMLRKAKKLGSTSSKKQIRPLTKLERRALLILGPCFERKTGVKSTIDLCNNSLPDQLSAVIKLEACQESPQIPYISNTWGNNDSEDNDKASEGGNNRGESADFIEEFGADSDTNSDEPIIHGIYPKWLVEIEKKRAEADYIRAKAEEHRASASAKNAKAALIQAEALKKLAEAAQTQAEAIMKIAIALENRSKRDDINVI